MSRFSILRIDHYDPVLLGKKSRVMYAIYATIPILLLNAINIFNVIELNFQIGLLISIPLIGLTYYILLKKVRSTINHLKTIGEIEITQSCLRKRIADSMVEYSFELIKEISLTRHIPATRFRESKTRYFSYILKIVFHNSPEESLVVSDRSIDHNQKISLADTMKTLKKIVPFKVIIEV